MNFSGKYPDTWQEIASQCKDAASWRCVRCGHPHSTPSNPVPCDDQCDIERHGGKLNDGRQRVLTVHHLDGDKSNCEWWNMAALCQVCHLVIQAKVIMERPFLMFPHSEWFVPYVAGYYAWHYLGQNISRDEAINRAGELLALPVTAVKGR